MVLKLSTLIIYNAIVVNSIAITALTTAVMRLWWSNCAEVVDGEFSSARVLPGVSPRSLISVCGRLIQDACKPRSDHISYPIIDDVLASTWLPLL